MFIFNLTYVKPISEVERFAQAHMDYLAANYEKGYFLCSGRKNPRTGGVILCTFDSREDAERVQHEDPFHIEGIAECEIIEFAPTKFLDKEIESAYNK